MLTSCAGKYKLIEPEKINYISTSRTSDVKLEYKYDLLHKKYSKKEVKNGIKLVALKITNNSDKNLVFGREARLIYENGSEVPVMENEYVFSLLRQEPAAYLLYLLLTPTQLYTENAEGEREKIFPLGLILGPGLAVGNLLFASSANKQFRMEMLEYNILGTEIKKGETKYGLVGIRSDSFDAIKLKIEQ